MTTRGKELLAILLCLLLSLASVAFSAAMWAANERQACAFKAAQRGAAHEWSLVQGCVLRKADGTLTPIVQTIDVLV